MKSQPIVCVIAALSMSLSSLAFAQNDKDRRSDEANRREQRPTQQQERLDRQERAGAWQQGRQDDRGPNRHAERGRGAGPEHSFYRGGRLPPQYRERHYVVEDWRGHHLNRPPTGYHWVQTGSDYVLAAIATGIIVSVLLNH